ncbi:CU044_2847 family protein [Micromonospora arborensis]|uniref:CU044_2847 family protein n=1 Tax=Micromonospora arborensis TaxID=2116518 RepID=UPI003409C951
MGGQIIPVRVGDVELWVETARVAGTENTSTAGRTQKVVDAFERAQDAIVAVSDQVARTVTRLAARSARPDRVDVEFGLKFSGKGDVIVASGSGEVALKVVISYDAGRSLDDRSDYSNDQELAEDSDVAP